MGRKSVACYFEQGPDLMSDLGERNQHITLFLASSGWGNAARKPLAGDASNRSYERLTDPVTGKTAVLMNAPPEKGEDVRPFVHIARILLSVGLSAPEIYNTDAENGLLLLEDLGDGLFANVARKNEVPEPILYGAAVDALVKLHQIPLPKGIGSYTPNLMAKLAARSYDWYLFGASGSKNTVGRWRMKRELVRLLKQLNQAQLVLTLRDFHSENLIWLPERSAEKRVGLLDFQDATSCHPAYDLASLLHDARRDIIPGLKEQMIDRYVTATQIDRAAFETAFAALSAQRNLRIIGGFARLSLQFGKPVYLELLPRVWRHLLSDLEHPKLNKLQNLVLNDLPAPSENVIKVLNEKCATIPTL